MTKKNPRNKVFDSYYPDLLVLLETFASSVIYDGDYLTAEDAVIDYLVDMYSSTFLDEIDYILDALGYNIYPQDLINLRNGVDTSSFVRSTALITSRASFFAPCGMISPWSSCPPSTINVLLSISYSISASGCSPIPNFSFTEAMI